MRNVVTVLGCLLLLCNTVKSKDECHGGDICSQENCSLNKSEKAIVCEDCETDKFDFNRLCTLFDRKPCFGRDAVKFFIAKMCETNEGDQNGNNNQGTIVIAVCVCVVVVVVAVLLTGVYCWRVRRGSNGKRNCEDFELRNNATTNDSYKMDKGPFSSRPGSTYNTIDDLQREHEYNTLEPQNSIPTHVERNQRTVDLQREHAYHTLEPQNSIPTHVERNQRTVDSVDIRKPIEPPAKGDNRKPIEPAAKVDSDSNNAYDDGEYNRLNYNKRSETTSDPSYSHLGSIENESDYNTCEADTISKTSTYTYGVPIKIKDLPNTKPTDTQTRPPMKVPNGADDDYVIPKKDLEEHPNISEEKPKAIVNPLNFNESRGYSASNFEDNSAKVTIEDTKKDTNDHVNDGYEEARIVKVESSGNTDNEIAKIELPRVQIGKTTEDKPNDGYETAALMQTKAAVNDGVNGPEMVKDIQKDMTGLNSSGSSVIIEPKMNRNDGYETARICQ